MNTKATAMRGAVSFNPFVSPPSGTEPRPVTVRIVLPARGEGMGDYEELLSPT